MNLFKKLISSVCAVAMMASMVVAVQAADPTGNDPKFVAEIKDGDYDAETGEGTLTISLQGLQTGESPLIMFTGYSMEVKLSPASAFDTSLYTYTPLSTAPIKQNIKNVAGSGALKIASGYNKTTESVKFNIAGLEVGEDTPVATLKFKLTEAGKKSGATITIPYAKYTGNAYSEDFSTVTQLTYFMNGIPDGNALATDRYLVVDDSKATIKGESSEPTVEKVDATPVGGVFEGFNGIDTDRSVAAMVDTTITKATNKVTWKINVTPQAGKTYTGPTEKEVTFGNLESGMTMKVGLVVSYADADIAEVQITGIEY